MKSRTFLSALFLRLLARTAASVIIVSGLAAGSGCAAFQNYNTRMEKSRRSFATGHFDQARLSISRGKPEKAILEKDDLVSLLELGLIEHTAGRFEKSARILSRADALIEYYENRAVISLSDAAAGAGTLLLNEGAAPYRGEAFEKILVPTFLAMNYLLQNDLEGARVEARRSYLRQQDVARMYERELDKARQEAEKSRREEEENIQRAKRLNQPPPPVLDREEFHQKIQGVYKDQDSVASRVLNAYQNAFTHCLAALIYGGLREWNETYVELRRAYALRPGASLLGPMLIEAARAGGFFEDIPQWENAFGLRSEEVLREAQEYPAELYVIFQNGWAPVKKQVSIVFGTPEGLVKIAVPKYVLQSGDARTLAISCGEKSVSTVILGDLEAQALQSLRDKMRVLALKMAVRIAGRLVAERVARQKMMEQFGPESGAFLARISASAVNLGLERADLRCWSLLPKNIQMARLRLPEGPATIHLRFEGGPAIPRRTIEMELKKDAPNVILVRSRGSTADVWTNRNP